MSKVIKQMQMDALKKDFNGVRDMVLLNIVGLGAIPENQIRLGQRKKGIRLQQVKNSLARRTFGEMGAEEKHGLPPRGKGLSHRARAFVKLAEACLSGGSDQ